MTTLGDAFTLKVSLFRLPFAVSTARPAAGTGLLIEINCEPVPEFKVTFVLLAKLINSNVADPRSLSCVVLDPPTVGPLITLSAGEAAGAVKVKLMTGTVSLIGARLEKRIRPPASVISPEPAPVAV